MQSRPSSRCVSWLAGLALLGAGLAAVPPAQAAPVFDDSASTLRTRSEAYTANGNCNTTNTASTATTTQAVVENGAATTFSRLHTAAWANNSDPADRGNTTASLGGSIRTSSVGPGSFSVDFASQGTAGMTSDQATSACTEYSVVRAYADLFFTVAQAGWLTIKVSNRGNAYSAGYVKRTTDDAQDESSGQDIKFDSSARIFLEAGSYLLFMEGQIHLRSNTARSVSGSSAVHAEFALPGSQSVATAGKGKRFVTFPAARSCAADTLSPTITPKGKRAKKIHSVRVFVNDTRVAKVTDPRKGQAIPLPLADDQDADVRALVKLDRVKKGVPPKTLEVTSSYLACS